MTTTFNYETCDEIKFLIHKTTHTTYTMTYDDFKNRDDISKHTESQMKRMWEHMVVASDDGQFENDDDEDEDEDEDEPDATDDLVEDKIGDALIDIVENDNEFQQKFGITMEAFNEMKLWVENE
jgi:hypothetical protein